ncbi:MAG: prolipoprotein diacylglyceryl transferase [Thermodesulfobacteriota bacterium]
MHPVLFDFGPVQIRFYGLMYVVAILVGSYIVKSEVRRKGISLTDDDVMNFVIWTVVSGVVGARLYYVVFNWGFYAANPVEIPAIWHGGLAIHGGLIGGFTFACFYLRSYEVNFWRMSDAVAPAIILGQAFGRFGNFMNGDAHGRPTDMPWGVVFPPESIAGREFPGIPTHPAMLYEMTINLSIFLFLWFVMRKQERGNGFIFALYLIMYSIGRFLVEHFRADSLMLGPLKAAQVMSIVLVLALTAVIAGKKLWTRTG